MKRIGIVSRVHGINYGANLQALALQNALEKLGFDAQYINYNVKISTHGFRRILSKGYELIRGFLGYKRRVKATNLFRCDIKFTRKLSDIEEVRNECENFDILMAGSDQIWNPRYYRSSHGLYLFENIGDNIPKVSYASSLGVTSLEEPYQTLLKKTLDKFVLVSCREDVGIKLLNEIGISAKRLIDPTFLLTAKEWGKFISPYPIVNGNYILCYLMPGVEPLNSYIISQAEAILKNRQGVNKIIVLGEKEYKGLFSRHTYIKTAGPVEFLNILFHADRVLTSSFHGTCFSIIFHKQFNSILDKDNKFNSRIENLLENLDLVSQITYMGSDVNEFKSVDYKSVDQLIEKERKKSIDYLNSLK